MAGHLREIAADSTLLRTSSWLDRVRRPVVICHGEQDAVVPTSQATLLRDVLRRNRVPHACLIFDGEGHVFRRAMAIGRALEAELSLYGQVLGLEPSESSRLVLNDGSFSIGRTK